MPILVVLHLLIAATFAVHAVRNGQPLFWLIILFSFPVIGSAVYFFAVFLPQSRIPFAARKLATAAGRALDPGRELREATDAFQFTPTAQNRIRLAAALLDAGEPQQAAEHYQACLTGPFADAPDLRFGAARAFAEAGHYERAIPALEALRQELPDYRSEQLGLVLAEAYARQGDRDRAHREFAGAVDRHGTFEARANYLSWMLETGQQVPQLAEQEAAIAQMMQRWSKATREINRPMLRRLEAARKR